MLELIVKNFGPIKSADIFTKRYNVLIGNTSTGKSVLAKLISLALDYDFLLIREGNFIAFNDLLKKYCIDFEFKADTLITIQFIGTTWNVRKGEFSIEKPFYKPLFDEKFNISEYSEFWKEFNMHVLDKNLPFETSNVDESIKAAMKKAEINFFEAIHKHQMPKLEGTTQLEMDYIFYNFLASVYSLYASIYIPAERNLMSIFSNNIFSLLKTNSNIPESIKRFGSWYEMAKGDNKQLSIDFAGVKIDFTEEINPITIADNQTSIRFEQASSGLQSIIPLWTVFLHGIKQFALGTAIIEEPELNLFPTLQVDLVNNLVAQLNQTKANLFITTHSPYILSVLDNLIYANDVYLKAKAANNEELVQRIENLVKPAMMINFDDVAAYHCQDNGEVVYMNDAEMRNTGAYALDSASSINSHIFNELMDIDNEL